MYRLALIASLSACGRVSFDAIADGRADTGDTDASAPFATPQPIVELNAGTNTDDPALTHDELEIILGSVRTGGAGKCDLYSSTRADRSSSWSVPVAITVLNTAGCDSNPMFFADDLGLRLTGDASASDLDIFETTRATRTSTWQPRQPVAGSVNTTMLDEFAATATSDDQLMVFTVFATTNDLVIVSRPNTAQAWSTRTTLTELDLGTERSAHLSPDGLQLWFVSDRAGGGGGGDDIWTATRASRTEPFGDPRPLTEINSAADEDDPWVSDDGNRIYFSRFPAGASTGGQLFSASR